MSNYQIQGGAPVAAQNTDVRADFITKTYTHLFGAILGFVAIEFYLFSSGLAEKLAKAMLSTSWLLVLGAFMIIGWFGSKVARTAESPAAQYGALALYVVAEAIIFVPMLFIAQAMAPGVIKSAAMISLLGFTGLTIVVFRTRRDFSFMGGVLQFGFIVALLLIVAGAIFGFELGTFFSIAMIALAGGAILYDTSTVMNHYPPDRHVSAALELFASVALLFWYVLRLFMSRD